jgi:plastocyanin
MIKVGDKIKWSLEDCTQHDASHKITWEMCTKGYCIVADLAPIDVPKDAPTQFGSFEEDWAMVYPLEDSKKVI